MAGQPVVAVSGDGWHGLALTLAPPEGAGLDHGLEIEVVGDEVTVGLDHGRADLS